MGRQQKRLDAKFNAKQRKDQDKKKKRHKNKYKNAERDPNGKPKTSKYAAKNQDPNHVSPWEKPTYKNCVFTTKCYQYGYRIEHIQHQIKFDAPTGDGTYCYLKLQHGKNGWSLSRIFRTKAKNIQDWPEQMLNVPKNLTLDQIVHLMSVWAYLGFELSKRSFVPKIEEENREQRLVIPKMFEAAHAIKQDDIFFSKRPS